jgi:integrase
MGRTLAGEGKVRYDEINNRYIWQGTITLWNGQKKRVARTGASEEEVVKKKRILLAEAEQGKAIAKNSLTVEQWGELWLDDYKKIDVSPTTWFNYKSHFKTHIYPTLGTINLQKISTNDIQKLIRKMTKTTKVSSIRKIISIFSSCLDKAINLGYINKNICDNVSLPKEPKNKKKRTLPNEDLMELLDIAHQEYISSKKIYNKTLYPALVLAVETGIRRSEVLGLKWENIDFENNKVLIKDIISVVNGKAYPKDTPKNEGSVRYLSVSPYWIDLISKLEHNCKYVFCSEVGTPITPRNWNRAFERWCTKAKINYTPHDLRHTFISDMINSGEAISTVQGLTGHSTLVSLLPYVHDSEKLKDAASKRRQKRLKFATNKLSATK